MIPYGRHYLDEEDIEAVVEVLRSGWITQGPLVEKFEETIANFVGSKYAVAVSSGTSALHLAVLAAGLEPNRALATSSITFVSSPNSALFVGARPLFTDIEPDTINMSVNSLGELLKNNEYVDVVMPVHFSGLPCDMHEIKKIADAHQSAVIEDAAHALGASYSDGSKVGCCSHSLMTVFSFHPVKSIAAGEGGMITTNDDKVYRKLLRLRSHGINKLDDQYQIEDQAYTNEIRNPWYYEMQELGYNYRITDIQCGLALSQFNKLSKFLSRRREIANRYDDAFSTIPNCHSIQLTGRDISANHLYVLMIDYPAIGLSRAQFMLKLREKEITAQVHYIPIPAQPFYRNLGYNSHEYPNAMEYYQQALSIPLYYDLNDQQVEYVIETFRELLS